MITFIEGVDGSGKTTLANKLKEKGFVQVNLPERSDNKSEENANWREFCYTYCNYVKNDVAFIADRSMISEIVYRMQDFQETFVTESLFAKFLHGIQVVYCNSGTSYQDAIARGDDNIKNVAQHVERSILYNGFIYFLQEVYEIPVCTYDWHNKKDFNKVVKFIERSIK